MNEILKMIGIKQLILLYHSSFPKNHSSDNLPQFSGLQIKKDRLISNGLTYPQAEDKCGEKRSRDRELLIIIGKEPSFSKRIIVHRYFLVLHFLFNLGYYIFICLGRVSLNKFLNMIFENTRYFSRQTFEISKSSLKIDRRNLFDAIEYEISYEQIHNKKKVQTTFNHGLLVTAFFFFVFGLLFQIGPNDELTITAIALALILSALAFSTRKKLVTIDTYDGNNIELYFTGQNKGTVINFANQIIDVSNRYLLNKYGKIDPALPVDPQLSNIQFLRNREIITEEDYETLKNRLLRRENQSTIGFGYNN